MANIQIFQQARVVPKAGGTFWYLITSDTNLRWTSTTLAVAGGLSYTEDYANHRFSITIPENTGSQRGIRCALRFVLQDYTEQTVSFEIIQDNSNDYVYFDSISQSTFSPAAGEQKSLILRTNLTSHSNWTITGTSYNRTTLVSTSFVPEVTWLGPFAGANNPYYTVKVTIPENEEDSRLDRIITLIDENNNPQTSTMVAQRAPSGSISLEYTTMDLPGDGDITYYNKVTHPHIAFSTLVCPSSGSANFTPSIVDRDGETYLKVQVFNSNIGGSSNKEATITVQGTDGLGNTITEDCQVIQHTDTVSLYSGQDLGTISWQETEQTIHLRASNIASIERAVITHPSIGVENIDFVATQTADGFNVVVTIPENTLYQNADFDIIFYGLSSYAAFGEWPSDRINGTQEAHPEGSITFNETQQYLHSLDGTAELHFSTEYMANTTITLSTSGDMDITYSRLIWDGGDTSTNNGKVVIDFPNNTTANRLTGTITLTGTDEWEVERTSSFTYIQVPISEDSFVSDVTASSNTLPYLNASVTLSITALNVDNLAITSNRNNISSVVITDTTPEVTDAPHLYEAVVSFTNNTGNSPKYIGLTVTCDNDADNSPFASSFSVAVPTIIQKCQPGSITINRQSIMVPAKANGSHRDVKVSSNRITGSLTATIDGDVDADLEWYTYENERWLLVKAAANTTGEELESTVTVSGTDYNGDTIEASYTVIQTADSPWVSFEPWQTFHNKGVPLPYNESHNSFHITTNRVYNLRNFEAEKYLPDQLRRWTLNGYSIIQNGEGDYTLVIDSGWNDTRQPIGPMFLEYEYDDDYGVKNPWQFTTYKGTYSYNSIRKCGIPGVLTISPTSRNVDGKAGSVTFTYYKDEWMSDGALSIAHTGGMNITGFYISGNNIVVEYGENRSSEDKVETITISGKDYQDLTITATATITQAPLSYIEFIDTELTLESTQKVANFRLEDFGVSNLAASFNGDVRITNFTFSRTSNGHILSVTTADNLAYVVLNTTITVTATGQKGEYLTTTAVLHKNGPDGNITLSPRNNYGSALGGIVEFASEANGMDSIDSYTSEGGLAITSASIYGNPVEFTIGAYPLTPVNWDDNISTDVFLTGIDYKGKQINSNTVTITQYGMDPTMEVTPDEETIGFEGGTLEFLVSLTGPAQVPTVNVNGTYSWVNEWSTSASRSNTLRVTIPANNTFAEKRVPITLSSTTLTGETLTQEIIVVQDPKEGGIIIDPPIKSVEKEAGTTQFTIAVDGVERNTLAMNYAGTSIISASFVGNKTGIIVNYRENTSVSTIVNTITVTGADEFGNSTSTTAELYQYGVDPSIAVNTIGIPNTQSSITVFVSTNGVGDLSVSFSGDIDIQDYTLTETTGGYYLTIVTPDNLENDPIFSTATFTGTVTTGRYQGQTITQDVQVIKYGKEGRIYADPTNVFVKKAGGEVKIALSYNNIDVSTVTATGGTFNGDKSELTYTVGANPNLTDRVITIDVSGTDVNSVTRTATITITQYGIDPYITIIPSSQTIRYNDRTATFTVTAYRATVSNVVFEGVLDITDYTLIDGTLTIESADNTDLFSITELITVNGVSENGENLSASATLVKFGTGGGIIIDPSFTIAGNAGLLVVPYYTDRIKEETIYAFINGDIDVTNIWVNRDGEFVIIEYNSNSSASDRASTLTLTCYDEEDIPRTTTSTITQLTSTYSFSINPTNRTMGYSDTTATNTVVSNNISSIISFAHYGEIDASYDNASTITITATVNNEDYKKYVAMNLTGITTSGDIVTAGAYVVQNDRNYTGWEFSFLDNSQINITVDGGGDRLNYDIISVNNTSNEQVPYYVSGFVLTGYWSTLPSVRYREGYPYVVIPINTREETRDVVITFTQEYSYLHLQANVHQEEGAIPDVHPIWEIDELSSPNGTFVEYHIKNDGEIIYAGKAYKYPEEINLIWSVNDTVSNYLGNGIYFTEGIQQIPNYSKDFFVKTSADAKYVETFYNSWAYKDTDYWLSDPIDKRVDTRQWLPVSFLSTIHPLINVGGRIYAALKENDGWTVMTNLRNLVVDCNSEITVSGYNNSTINYKIASGDYVLYYSNAYGGWDSILLTGKVKKTDEIEHLNYKKRSNSQYKFSKINYQNNITPTWSLNTGISIDGTKMYHLLESTMVYLHNLETNEIIPVVITNSQCEYLTRKNNGKRPYFYTITVEESNTKLRK